MTWRKYFEMFYIFFKLSAFALGAASVTIPLIENEVVDKKQWINREEFIDIVALAQSAPGPITTNIAVFVGYKVAGILGVIFTVLGSIMTPFIGILIVAPFFDKMRDNAVVEKVFKGIGPALVAIIAAQAFRFGKTANLNRKSIVIPIIVALLIAFLKVNPIHIIIVAALLGIIYGTIKGGAAR